MEAVMEKSTTEAPARKPIPEDTDLRVVRFQNLEQRGMPLEFSAGAPISQDIRNYVLKDGHAYNLPRRLRDHILSLAYPKYKDIEDPNFPGSGIMKSMQDGVVNRFSLSEVDSKENIVYEHLREKLNCKVLPGALENSSYIPELVQNSTQIEKDKRTVLAETENANLIKENDKQAMQIKDLIASVNMLKANIKELKKQKNEG